MRTGYLWAAIVGLLLGSFYTALADRVLFYYYGPGRKQPGRLVRLLSSPSECRSCGRRLTFGELIPLASFLFLRGRCAGCRARLGWWTLIGELLPGILLPLQLLGGASWPAALLTTMAVGHLYVTVVTDYNFFLIDHENTAFVALWATLAVLIQADFRVQPLMTPAITAASCVGIFGLLYLAGRGKAMGFADVLLAGSVALVVGFPWVLALFTTASLGAIVYVFAIRQDRRAAAPFGVFLALATALVVILRSLWSAFGSSYSLPYT